MQSRRIQHFCLGSLMPKYKISSMVFIFLFISPLLVTQGFASGKAEDELDARFTWTIKWEEEPGQGKIQEKGNCTIQMEGKIVKYQEDEDEDDSEFLRYIPKDMNATYSYENEWHNIEPTDECYGMVGQENATGSVKIKSIDEASGPSDGMFELQALLGYGGQIYMMQWLAQVSPEKMMDVDKQPINDNYTFKLFVPFETQVWVREDCFTSESSIPRTFMFELYIDEYKKGGMSGAFDHPATAHTFQQLGYGSCCGVTRYTPSEGSYNTMSTVSWTFGKVATLQILYWDKDTKKWVNINNETIDVITGEQVKLKARVLPEEEGPPTKGRWTIDDGDNENGKFIKEYDADFRKGKVIRLDEKEMQQTEITFYWTDEGKAKVTFEAMANDNPLTAETEFSIRKPQYNVIVEAAEKSSIVTAMFKPLKSDNCWVDVQEEDLIAQKNKWFRYDGITFTPKPVGSKEGETQWVQILESEEYTQIWDDRTYEKWHLKGEVLDGCYPYPAKGDIAEDAPALPLERNGKRIRARDSRGNFLDTQLYETKIKEDFRMYLMFRPDGTGNEWIPLKVVKWNYDAEAQFYHVDENGENIWRTWVGKVTPAQPEAEDTNEYPEWGEGMNAGNPKVYESE